MSKHTSGNWRADFGEKYSVRDDKVFLLATATWLGDPRKAESGITRRRPWWEVKANVRVMAAGPDLLEALIMVRDADNDCRMDGFRTIPEVARWRIDRAIAKAEGKS